MFALPVSNVLKAHQAKQRVQVDITNQEMHQLLANCVQLVTTVHRKSFLVLQQVQLLQ